MVSWGLLVVPKRNRSLSTTPGLPGGSGADRRLRPSKDSQAGLPGLARLELGVGPAEDHLGALPPDLRGSHETARLQLPLVIALQARPVSSGFLPSGQP